jgi:NAD(P)H-hydrate epimerase
MHHPVTREQMIALDRWAIQDIGIPGIVLMENAGRAVAERARALLPSPESGAVLVLAGKGNNGGDGFVVSRHLWNGGYRVQVRVFGSVDQYPEGSDPAINLGVIRKLGLDVTTSEDEIGCGDAPEPGLIIDALFGTGLRGAPRPPADRLIASVNAMAARGVPVLAVDTPSGLDCNTGAVPGVAVKATCTVTLARAKVGFFQGQGPDHVGDLEVADISIPPAGPGCPAD